MRSTLVAPRGPRYLTDALAGVDTSAAVREFADATSARTAGGRFPLPGLGNMRAGKQVCVHAAITRFLAAGLRAGLPRDWAERLAAFVHAEIDRLWTALPPLAEARRAAAKADAQEDIHEIDALTLDTLDALRAEERVCRVDLAVGHVRLAALQKEIARREREATR
jgi:hypothetical protein